MLLTLWSVAGCPPRAVVLLSEEREAAASRVARLTKTRQNEYRKTDYGKPIAVDAMKKVRVRATRLTSSLACRGATLRKEKDRKKYTKNLRI